MGRRPWWQTPTNPEIEFLAEIDANLAAAQQVGEDVAREILNFIEDNRPCPACPKRVGDHTRKELRRCDRSRPNLTLVEDGEGNVYRIGGEVA